MELGRQAITGGRVLDSTFLPRRRSPVQGGTEYDRLVPWRLAMLWQGQNIDSPQGNADWLIVDSNETPGGLASTDVTPEGFVSRSILLLELSNADQTSSTMSAAMSFSPTTNTLTTASTRHYQKRPIGIPTSVSLMSDAKASGSHTPSKTTYLCCQRRTKSSAWMA